MATPSSGSTSRSKGSGCDLARLDGDDGDIDLGVVVDDGAGYGAAADLDRRLVDAGDDVRVGHHPVAVRTGSRSPRCPRSQELKPSTFTTGWLGADHVGVGQQPLRAGPDGDDPLGGERLEVAREERRADDVVERLEQVRRRGRQQPSTSLRTDDSRTSGVMPEMPEPAIATPSAHDTSSTAAPLRTAPPAASTARNGCQRDRVAQPRAGVLEERLPEARGQDHDEQRAQRDQHRLGLASPSARGASQTPVSPPRSSPAVAPRR